MLKAKLIDMNTSSMEIRSHLNKCQTYSDKVEKAVHVMKAHHCFTKTSEKEMGSKLNKCQEDT